MSAIERYDDPRDPIPTDPNWGANSVRPLHAGETDPGPSPEEAIPDAAPVDAKGHYIFASERHEADLLAAARAARNWIAQRCTGVAGYTLYVATLDGALKPYGEEPR